ncbi:MAG: 1-phosphofructokinase [Methanothrix sp.]|jgi:6-phosphofructokinase 2|uniref:1-phosphofructokinase n=1 Tax=Methanothrix harundinacea TaxID=301375 RepID=A0A101FV79_9EURY|nr:MAG: Fructose-1-phosphate kinase [Methanothrix harundinacea]MDD2638808.1 1-phosphofructokinase [Methanothrix sp.]MDI9398553.1 1-phosphofructokinase [Euryarchaeota archaeon]KUK97398.1 MAG: Fructose-1-phosphate kinase [Methanothrix harundinacea]MCP1391617.1 1-phosphofructokinase [Methanothrix harundinacea]
MIYTITLNPALDRTLWINEIREDVSNRIIREESYAGGKGIDVSKVLTALGVENQALGFIAGFAGRQLEAQLIRDGTSCGFIPVSGETRINIVIHEMNTGKQIILNSSGPEVKPFELIEINDVVKRLEDPEFISIGGSLPPGAHPEIYRKIIETGRLRGARVVLDVDREALKIGIQGKPDIIKPNIHELSTLVGRRLEKRDEILDAAHEINRKGVRIVLVSMGPRGILLVSDGKNYQAVPPKVEVVNTIGAGDSSVAGFIYGQVSGMDLKKSLIYATAAGTATTLRVGTALARKEDVEMIVPQAKLEIISEE